MLTDLENGIGLDIVRSLQAQGTAFLDMLAVLLHNLGGDLGYILVLPIVYWSVSRYRGRQLLFVLLIGLVGLLAFKEVIASPRPFIQHPDQVTALVEEDGYGLPSGHVVLSIVIWGYIASVVKRWWVWLLVAFYVLLIAWSRMYAGVHYPQDVVGGVIVGAGLLALSLALLKPVARLWASAAWWHKLIVMTVLGIVVALLFTVDDNGASTAGLFIGGGIGLVLEERRLRFSTAGSTGLRILRSVIGLVVVGAVFFGLRIAFADLTPETVWRVARYAVTAIAALFVFPWGAVSAGLMERREAVVDVTLG